MPPRLMQDLERGRPQLTELHVALDMRARKHEMRSQSSALVALPGGSATLEELLEAISLKRLGLDVHPTVPVNARDD